MPSIEFGQPITRPDHGAGRIYGYEPETPPIRHGVRDASAHPLGAALDHVPSGDNRYFFSTVPAGAATFAPPPEQTDLLLDALADPGTPPGSLPAIAHGLAARLGLQEELRGLVAQGKDFLGMVEAWRPDGCVTLVARADPDDPYWDQLDAPRLLKAIIELASREPHDPQLCMKVRGLLLNLLSDVPALGPHQASEDVPGPGSAAGRSPPANPQADAAGQSDQPATRSRYRKVHADDIPTLLVPIQNTPASAFLEASGRPCQNLQDVTMRLIRKYTVLPRQSEALSPENGDRRDLTPRGIYPHVSVRKVPDFPSLGVAFENRERCLSIVWDPAGNRYAVLAHGDGDFRPVAHVDSQTGEVKVDAGAGAEAEPYLKLLSELDHESYCVLSIQESIERMLAPPQRQPPPSNFRRVLAGISSFLSK